MRLTYSSVAVAIFLAGQYQALPLSSRQIDESQTGLIGTAATVLQSTPIVGTIVDQAVGTLGVGNLISLDGVTGPTGSLGTDGALSTLASAVVKRDYASGMFGNVLGYMEAIPVAGNLVSMMADTASGMMESSGAGNMPEALPSLVKRDEYVQSHNGFIGTVADVLQPTPIVGNLAHGLTTTIGITDLISLDGLTGSVGSLGVDGALSTTASAIVKRDQYAAPPQDYEADSQTGLIGTVTNVLQPTPIIGNLAYELGDNLGVSHLISLGGVTGAEGSLGADAALSTTASAIVKRDQYDDESQSGLIGNVATVLQPVPVFGSLASGLDSALGTGSALSLDGLTGPDGSLGYDGALSTLTSAIVKRDSSSDSASDFFNGVLSGDSQHLDEFQNKLFQSANDQAENFGQFDAIKSAQEASDAAQTHAEPMLETGSSAIQSTAQGNLQSLSNFGENLDKSTQTAASAAQSQADSAFQTGASGIHSIYETGSSGIKSAFNKGFSLFQ